MALSRPVFVALLGAVLCAGMFYATLGARQARDDSRPTATPSAKRLAPSTAGRRPAEASPGGHSPGAAAEAARSKVRSATPGGEAGSAAGVPARVDRALERNRTVVLFFHQHGGADDDATAAAVRSLRGRPGLSVFSAPISRLADFRGVTGEAGISQAPAVLILGRGRGRLVEGFVDGETLAQEVSDVR